MAGMLASWKFYLKSHFLREDFLNSPIITLLHSSKLIFFITLFTVKSSFSCVYLLVPWTLSVSFSIIISLQILNVSLCKRKWMGYKTLMERLRRGTGFFTVRGKKKKRMGTNTNNLVDVEAHSKGSLYLRVSIFSEIGRSWECFRLWLAGYLVFIAAIRNFKQESDVIRCNFRIANLPE